MKYEEDGTFWIIIKTILNSVDLLLWILIFFFFKSSQISKTVTFSVFTKLYTCFLHLNSLSEVCSPILQYFNRSKKELFKFQAESLVLMWILGWIPIMHSCFAPKTHCFNSMSCEFSSILWPVCINKYICYFVTTIINYSTFQKNLYWTQKWLNTHPLLRVKRI